MFRRSTLGLSLCGLLFAAAGLGRAQERGPGAALPVGSAMRDFGLRALEPDGSGLGEQIWLSDFVGKRPRKEAKKLLLLSFFAVWCQPCVDELELLSRLQKDYGAAGLQVLSVHVRAPGESLDDAMARTRTLWRERAPGFPILFDRYTDRNQRLYVGERGALPCAVLIDSDGRIAARFQGAAQGTLAELKASVSRALGGEP